MKGRWSTCPTLRVGNGHVYVHVHVLYMQQKNCIHMYMYTNMCSRSLSHECNDQCVVSLLHVRATVQGPHPLHPGEVDGGGLVNAHTAADHTQGAVVAMARAGDDLVGREREGGGGRGREGERMYRVYMYMNVYMEIYGISSSSLPPSLPPSSLLPSLPYHILPLFVQVHDTHVQYRCQTSECLHDLHEAAVLICCSAELYMCTQANQYTYMYIHSTVYNVHV